MPRSFGYNIASRLIPLSNRERESRNDLIDAQHDKKMRAIAKLENNLASLANIRNTCTEEREQFAAQVARLDDEIAHLNALIVATDEQIEKELSK